MPKDREESDKDKTSHLEEARETFTQKEKKPPKDGSKGDDPGMDPEKVLKKKD